MPRHIITHPRSLQFAQSNPHAKHMQTHGHVFCKHVKFFILVNRCTFESTTKPHCSVRIHMLYAHQLPPSNTRIGFDLGLVIPCVASTYAVMEDHKDTPTLRNICSPCWCTSRYMSTIPLYTHRYIGLFNSCWAELSVFLMGMHECARML